jgi:NTE family protein
MGAMIAAGIATRTDEELSEMLSDPSDIQRIGLRLVRLSAARKQGALLDPSVMLDTVRHNVGYTTFQQAYERTGRVLNVSVSPARDRQKPRILSHLTAPDALVCVAALASGAVPVAFPPVSLKALDVDGREIDYLPSERWIDGSMHGDLPKMRLSRLHNVNHFIVSQTNPHVLPFVWHQGRGGVGPALTGLISVTARSQGALAADVLRRVNTKHRGPARLLADRAYALFNQDYSGDIDIHPQFHWKLYRKVAANPTRADLDAFILEGERAVWPRIPTIRNQTRLGRVFAECVATMRAQVQAKPS